MKNISLRLVLLPFLLIPFAGNTQTSSQPQRPLWEVGVGALAAYGADYPAADTSSVNGIPLPYVIYRGDFLRVGDGGGIRGVFVDDQRWELDLSADASFNSESDDSKVRQGMPDLDFLAEVGPQLKYKIMNTSLQSIQVQLPVRGVFSIGDGLSVKGHGVTVAPRLSARQSGVDLPLLDNPVTVFASVGPTFATQELHEYFYHVSPAFATASRPAYKAKSGYMGSELSLGASTSLTPRVRAFAGTQIGYYGGSANADSPLHKKDVNAGVALGLTWSFYQSDAKVSR